ncbi:unnamed protein product [Bemisia tabaci]|uniref:Uncharacterized protein n=1 Tax=Bemisia tabaci TaxID=7038 RepID=A0A9P0F2B3_BEMTA|nr:unnamed protein product [Bemisia tabaci]
MSVSFNIVTKGSDPRIATCRGKLQNKRSKLNQEINKELRLRAGAENLFKNNNRLAGQILTLLLTMPKLHDAKPRALFREVNILKKTSYFSFTAI